jgi:RNA polymerase sigma-70 factor (ECF subfamily)
VTKAQSGDAEAFGRLVSTFHLGVRLYLAVRMNDTHEADELAQEVFLTAFRRIDRFDTSLPQPFEAWLRGIAANLLRNHRRKSRPVAVGGTEVVEGLIDAEMAARQESASLSRALEALRKCMAKLSTKARRVVHWRYTEGMSIAQLCERLHQKHSAVTMLLHRLREQLGTCMNRKLAEDDMV